MKLVVDDKIPYIYEFFTSCDEIVYLPGEKITHTDLQDADMLLTRTVTQVDAALLKNTSVKFVGTATTGTDHVDKDWLAENRIAFADAAGANAQAVAEYVICCLAALKKQNYLSGKNIAGVIGCGRIGRLVATLFDALGFEVMCYDPLLTERLNFNFVSLEKLISESDVISIHTPLTKNGPHPTFYLLNDSLIKKIKPGAILFNTARGSVINESALLQAKNITLCLDVWEHEPSISLALLSKVIIGTPHIAGYSHQAKYRATQMIYKSAAEFFNWPSITTEKNISSCNMLLEFLKSNWVEKALTIYDPLAHTQQFRGAFKNAHTKEDIEKIFIRERKEYPLR